MLSTETIDRKSVGLDAREPEAILSVILQSQVEALLSLDRSRTSIADAAAMLTGIVRGGGKIAYAAAGSSALMAMADGLELPGTFGLPSDRVKILLAGGLASLSDMLGGTEDDSLQGLSDVQSAGIGPNDCLIAVSASGSTPYTVAALVQASRSGAKTIAIANNPDAPLLKSADVAILLSTPPEIVGGSTRLGAATAQKAALNMMSTLMAIHLGHIYDGRMVNLRADNEKLRQRACRIVSEIGGCDDAASRRLLGSTGGSVKHAILLAGGIPSIAHADELLEKYSGNLRRALAEIDATPNVRS
ncbi:MAG: N-acetylmuramic acid 6-phosphate etherase [Hoeflea sp.]|uniref:N-acetylmuramic acid 6-phosphate etherase n=1 Tax=Hoeflea sp. TaxID=1940281 RepID=UPI003EF5EDD9